MEKVNMINKKKVLITIGIILIFIFLIVFSIITPNKEEIGINALVVGKDVKLYSDPVEKTNKVKEVISENSEVKVIDCILENNIEWYLVRLEDNKKGYIKSEYIDYFIKDKSDYVLTSDFSSHNFKDVFDNKKDIEAFLLKYNVSYVYIRAGGRGYGKEGNFYTDKKYEDFKNACEYLGIEYGYYFLDEALNSKEIQEEVNFIDDFMKNNKSELCKLPVVIDVEEHEEKGRCADIWDERAELVTKLIKKLEALDYDVLLYSNANTCNKYLTSISSKLWLAYYPEQTFIPDYWYTKTEQPATSNAKMMKKLVGWQFSESGVKHVIEENIDLSIFKNNFFE